MAWVRRFVRELDKRKVDIVYDKDQQERFVDPLYNAMTRSQKDGEIMKLVGKIDFCHVFMPIFTPGYLEGIGYPDGKMVPQSGKISWVFDEFQHSLFLGAARRIETVPVNRRCNLGRLPPGFHRGNTLDLRTEEAFAIKLDGLANYLCLNRLVKIVPDIKDYEECWE